MPTPPLNRTSFAQRSGRKKNWCRSHAQSHRTRYLRSRRPCWCDHPHSAVAHRRAATQNTSSLGSLRDRRIRVALHRGPCLSSVNRWVRQEGCHFGTRVAICSSLIASTLYVLADSSKTAWQEMKFGSGHRACGVGVCARRLRWFFHRRAEEIEERERSLRISHRRELG